MEIIRHRVNSIADLKSIDHSLGCEIDLRSSVNEPGKIHLSHDAWVKGDDFETWLKVFKDKNQSGILILNTKEDGLESKILELLKKYSIEKYFFLDTALPTLVRWTMREKNKNFAVRLSKHEPLDAILPFKELAKWCWVDCFDKIAIDPLALKNTQKHFSTCLVSPELQGGDQNEIASFKKQLSSANAVCTKYPEKWRL